MKVRVSIIFIVIQAITCEKTVSKLRKKLMVPKINEECKKIKCPSIEEPVCLKMTRHDLGHSMHILAVNKCELNYIKCHDDVEAKIVAMKYCSHNTAPTVRNNKNKMGKHIRVKRRAAKSMHAQKRRFKGDKQKKRFELHKARLIRKKLARMQRNNVISNVINKYSVLNYINRLKKKHGADKHGRQRLARPQGDWEAKQRLKIMDGMAGYKFNMESKEMEHGPKDFLKFIEARVDIPSKEKLYDVEDSKEQPPPPQLSLHLDDFDMLSEEFTNTSTESSDSTDLTDYDTLCPAVCPSRDVMVCGRCQHGIYRTFPSVCHMKMFGCRHKDEILELISRYPCVLSAPLQSGDKMKPKGRLQEAGDNDEILWFLNCQQRGKGFVKDLNGKLSCAANFRKDPAMGYKEGDRYFHFPGDGDDTMHLVDAEEPIDFEFIKKHTKYPADYGYWLYTRNNPISAQIIKFGDNDSVAESNYDISKTTVFTIHGWLGDGKTVMNQLLREAFLEDDVNLIVFDWSVVAKATYITAKTGTAAVGRGLGQFIKWLVSLGASYENIHLVGFSLGAHLVGNAGRETESAVRRITALDPAYPLWTGDNGRVVATDGQYVEVIHTNTAVFGWTEPCGHADFYPNGGYRQPVCFFSICSHHLAYWYMYRSVKSNQLLAKECASLSEANNDDYTFECTGEVYPMGNSDLNKSRSGIFRVNTHEIDPY